MGMHWRKVWRQLRWSFAQRGAQGTLRAALTRLRRRSDEQELAAVHPFDAQFGVDTGGLIGGGELAGGSRNDRFITAYHAASPARVIQALERWNSTLTEHRVEDYVFLDVGCGKGRALMLASEWSFRAALGVELNAGLAQITENNLRRWRDLGRPRCDVGVVRADAAEFPFPAPPLLVFLYNPFQAPVLRRLLERLELASADAAGPIDVIYMVPSQETVFAEFPLFVLLWSATMGAPAEPDGASSPQDRCSLYRR